MTQHVVGVCVVVGRDLKGNAMVNLDDSDDVVSYLLGELIKLAVVDLHLPGSPGRSGGEVLEAPVRGENIIEEIETVPSDIHLIDLQQKQT